MKFLTTPILLIFAITLVLWGVSSWFISKISKQHFDLAIEELATGHAKEFFEVEALSYQEKLYGTSAELMLIPTSALTEGIGNQKLRLSRSNGPIFINTDGVQLGLARWEIEPFENAGNYEAAGSVTVGFFDKLTFRFDASELSLPSMTFDTLSMHGQINTDSFDNDITVEVSDLNYTAKQFAMHFPSISLIAKRSMQTKPTNEKGLIKLAVDANDAQLTISRQLKKIPFNIQSHGSIWVNNDTLSSDWQSSIATGQLLAVKEIGNAQKSDYLQTEISLQFRELLTSGFWQYLKDQSQIYSLFQQAEWAVEEVETPEQQDFLRSLFLDVDRIKRSQLSNPLKPLLIADRSKLAANIKVSNGEDDTSSELTLGGNATSKAKQPELKLRGDVRIDREMLTERWSALLDKWSNRRWFRRYETEFESDITVRSERILLNDMIVSVDALSAELSQAFTDK